MSSNNKNLRAIVIGSGSIAQNCIIRLISNGFFLCIIEFSQNKSKSLESISKRNNLDYLYLENKKDISLFFDQVQEKTLVVSASNRYIFSENDIKNENLFIINYHSSLLPKYPGRNAEAWAIYEGDSKSGITWHLVNKEIDGGAIIYQDEVEITDQTTSISLLKSFNYLATKGIEKIILDYINENILFHEQINNNDKKIKYSWMKPNNGVLDISWDEKKILKFLRAYDYGIFKNLGNFEVPELCSGVKFYQYEIHTKSNFTPKYQESLRFNKETFVFELLIDE